LLAKEITPVGGFAYRQTQSRTENINNLAYCYDMEFFYFCLAEIFKTFSIGL